MSGYTASDVRFYQNGTKYTDKNGASHPFTTAYIVYTPTDKKYQNTTPLVLVQVCRVCCTINSIGV